MCAFEVETGPLCACIAQPVGMNSCFDLLLFTTQMCILPSIQMRKRHVRTVQVYQPQKGAFTIKFPHTTFMRQKLLHSDF